MKGNARKRQRAQGTRLLKLLTLLRAEAQTLSHLSGVSTLLVLATCSQHQHLWPLAGTVLSVCALATLRALRQEWQARKNTQAAHAAAHTLLETLQ